MIWGCRDMRAGVRCVRVFRGLMLRGAASRGLILRGLMLRGAAPRGELSFGTLPRGVLSRFVAGMALLFSVMSPVVGFWVASAALPVSSDLPVSHTLPPYSGQSLIFAHPSPSIQEKDPNFDPTPNLTALQERFEAGALFEADFLHRFEDDFTGEIQTYRGRILITKNEYLVRGELRRMLVDSLYSYVYEEDRNRLIISDYVEEDDEFAPSRVFKGMDETYRITESAQGAPGDATSTAGTAGTTGAKEPNSGIVSIEFVTNDPFAIYPTATLRLRNGVPEALNAEDSAQNRIFIRFDEGRFRDGSITLGMLKVPEDAEIIDLREEADRSRTNRTQ